MYYFIQFNNKWNYAGVSREIHDRNTPHFHVLCAVVVLVLVGFLTGNWTSCVIADYASVKVIIVG
ncbi:TPA: hypothetical protein HMM82_06725 [Escherichia coli]|nr:hypothetical protein [Escherichia coli]EFN8657301.1 hypothetical protein [Escherichia coli O83]EEY5490922.1 hypothetical protein [Escherichia coli]EEY6120088.1 hypothetical protein [Escherichia coli]EFN7494682.1 hypothetical protein [Escherichia coli]